MYQNCTLTTACFNLTKYHSGCKSLSEIIISISLIYFQNQVDKWPESGFVKKLQRRTDGYYYYYNRARECPDKDIPKCKIYVY